jgi:hypothetical protein
VAEESTIVKQMLEETKSFSKSVFSSSVNVQKTMLQLMDISNKLDATVTSSGLLVNIVQETSSNLQESEKGFNVGKPRFEVGEIKRAHMAWLEILVAVIQGEKAMKAENVPSSKECEFGRWFEKEGQMLKDHSHFNALAESHHKVHEAAREVVHLISENRKSEAEAKLAAFDKLRRTLFDHLDQIYVETMYYK